MCRHLLGAIGSEERTWSRNSAVPGQTEPVPDAEQSSGVDAAEQLSSVEAVPLVM